MFNWAKRQKLSQRCSPQKSSSSKATKFSTYQSQSSYHKKLLKYHRNYVEKSVEKRIRNFIHEPSSNSKKQLTQALNKKFKQRLQLSKQKKRNQSKPQIQITVILPNFYLKQFCSVYQQKKQKKQGIFLFANILQGMGLIQDMVYDRQLIRQIYYQLESPDILSTFVFIEICLDGKVDLKESYQVIKKQIDFNLNMIKAQKIIDHKLGHQFFQQLRNNRIIRKN